MNSEALNEEYTKLLTKAYYGQATEDDLNRMKEIWSMFNA